VSDAEAVVWREQFIRRIVLDKDVEDVYEALSLQGWKLSEPEELEHPAQLEFMREEFPAGPGGSIIPIVNKLSAEGWKNIEVETEEEGIHPFNVNASRIKHVAFEIRGTRRVPTTIRFVTTAPVPPPLNPGFGAVPGFLPEDVK